MPRDRLSKHRGAISELVASAWLLGQGYEIFRNVSQHGDVDIVGWKDGKFTSFDVKTISGQTPGNFLLKPSQADRKVKLLYVYIDGTCKISEASAEPAVITCKECERPFSRRTSRKVFCSERCKRLGYLRRHPKTSTRGRAARIALFAHKAV